MVGVVVKVGGEGVVVNFLGYLSLGIVVKVVEDGGNGLHSRGDCDGIGSEVCVFGQNGVSRFPASWGVAADATGDRGSGKGGVEGAESV